MKIIKAEIQNLDDLTPLFDGYRVFYGQPSDIEAVKPFLIERLTKQDTIIYIAYIDDEAVGFTHLFHSFSSVYMQPLFILNDLFVASNHRKKGIGVALMEKAKELCRNLDYKGIALQTETTNPAQHLYESLGWEIDKDLQYFWVKK